MTLVEEYRNQLQWRRWARVLDELPAMDGKVVLDLGCGVGDQAAALVARGARVIGIDTNEALLDAARARCIPHTEFRNADLRALSPVNLRADAVWCSFAAAYFPRLDQVLGVWRQLIAPDGWIALTEIDDLFGHEPLDELTATTLDAYQEAALAADRYDFRMGRKLRAFVEAAGFRVFANIELNDDEPAFDGPAKPDVVEGWSARLARMTALQEFCGDNFNHVRGQLLSSLTSSAASLTGPRARMSGDEARLMALGVGTA